MSFFTTEPALKPVYHYRQGLLNDLDGRTGECQFPEQVDPPRIGGKTLFRIYKCPECASILFANGGKPDQTEALAVVFVICGCCSYPDFVRDLPYPEDLCPCFGWVYIDDDD